MRDLQMSGMLSCGRSCEECFGAGRRFYGSRTEDEDYRECTDCHGTGVMLTALGREVIALMDEVAKIRRERAQS